MFRLDGKVAIVTGGNSGIGRGIATMFAKQGAKVVIVGRNMARNEETAAEIEKDGGTAWAFQCDMGDEDNVKALIDATVEKFGELNIMVNNAGSIVQANLVDLEKADWDKLIRNDLTSVYLGSRYAAIQMVKQGKGGRIINLSSIHAKISEPQCSVYTAAKGGIEGFTRTIATELAPHHITANVLAPGATYTDFTIPMYTESVTEALYNRIPLAAIAEPKDIACGALFMASDEAWYMTGARICIDGGYEMDGSLPGAEYWSE